jgi:hypothetical protein
VLFYCRIDLILPNRGVWKLCMHPINNYKKLFWCWPHLRLSINYKVDSSWIILFFFYLSIINWFDQASSYYLHKGFYETHQWIPCFQTITFSSRPNNGLSNSMPIPISLLKCNQRDASFESILKINFVKDPTHIIQNMQSFDYFVFWK